MQIKKAQYMNEERDTVVITTEEDKQVFVPQPSDTWIQDELDAWIEQGNEIEASVEETSLDVAIQKKVIEIESEMNRMFRHGMNYTFPDGEEDIIQMGDDDIRNILAVNMRAMQLVQDGAGDDQMKFRSLSNINHEMTAKQVVDMSTEVFNRTSVLFDKSWDLKDKARSVTSKEELNDIVWEEDTYHGYSK